MKRCTALLLCFIMICFSLVSCKKRGDTPLDKFNGWWTRPEGYEKTGESALTDTFEISAPDCMLTCYSVYGVISGKYACSADGDILTVTVDAVGDITLTLDGDSLIDSDSGVTEYVRGEAIQPVDTSIFNGVWYKNGDTYSDSYRISEGVYEFFYGNMPGVPQHAGTWTSEENVRYTADGVGYDEVLLKISNHYADDVFREEYEFALLCGGLVLYDNYNSEFFVRESALKDKEGMQAIKQFTLVSEEWCSYTAAGELYAYLEFNYYSSTLEIVRCPINADSTATEREALGKWHLDGDVILIEYENSVKESIPYSGSEITLPSLGMTFTRDEY